MKFIKNIREGDRLGCIYLCKQRTPAVTKNGKAYENLVLQDRTGTVDGKIWDPHSNGIEDFQALDYIEIIADVTSFNGALQLNIKRARKARPGEYDPSDYLPVSEHDVDEMYEELLKFIQSVGEPHLRKLLDSFFVEDAAFAQSFKMHSAAKTVHHGFVGGLLEHTLSVTRLCDYYTLRYPFLNRDLLISAALLHDIGKVYELSEFPQNDYTDEGQLLGHIALGSEMVAEHAHRIDGFPKQLENELKHCILAHHGELEFGSPKKPALAEALALNLADNTDAKLETMKEILVNAGDKTDWLGFNRFMDSNVRKTGDWKS